MGYYNGNGVIVSGSNTKRLFGTLMYNYGQHVYQKSVLTVTKKNGVSLATCQGLSASATFSKSTFSRTGDYPWMGINGDVTDYSYSQINGSNLYELTIRHEVTTGE